MNSRAVNLAEREAWSMLLFADGLEAAVDVATGDSTIDYDANGAVIYARKARSLAHETVRLIDALRAERSARTAIQEERDRLTAMLREPGRTPMSRKITPASTLPCPEPLTAEQLAMLAEADNAARRRAK